MGAVVAGALPNDNICAHVVITDCKKGGNRTQPDKTKQRA